MVELFERIWPGWSAEQAHPAHMVRTTSSERLQALAADQAIVRELAGAKGAPRRRDHRPDLVRRPRRLAGRTGGLLLPRVRPQRGAAAVLGRPRRARRRPPEGRVRPRRAAGRRRPAVHRGLLPPAARRRRLAAGALPPTRPRRRSALDDTGVRSTVDLAGDRSRSPGSGGPTSAGSRCTCSTPTVEGNRPTASPSPTGSTAATRSTAAPGDRARHRRRARPARARPRARRCSTPTRATPGSSASSGSASRSPPGCRSPRRSRRCAPAACSPPTRRCRPASTASRAA